MLLDLHEHVFKTLKTQPKNITQNPERKQWETSFLKF